MNVAEAVTWVVGLTKAVTSTLARQGAKVADNVVESMESKTYTTGAREISVEEYLKRERLAVDQYNDIRLSNTDVLEISSNLALPEFQVQRVKEHGCVCNMAHIRLMISNRLSMNFLNLNLKIFFELTTVQHMIKHNYVTQAR